MSSLPDVIVLSRLQFAITTLFHILWPVLTIGLSLFLVVTERLWLRTGEVAWYHHSRFWSRLLMLNFGVGVVTGLPLEFEFGADWATFSTIAGGFFGNLLGFEGAMAFMLEAGFLGIMMFGWDKVPRSVHLLATAMVAAGASLSAFWILDANSWMQTPAGGHMEDGHFVLDSYLDAIFNPDVPWGVSHMWVACLETSLFVIGGISAWYILKRRQVAFFRRSFLLAATIAIVVTPVQIWLGDSSGKAVFADQPAKGAALEGHWNTNPPGTAAPWAIIAWPDKSAQRNDWAVEIPGLLSWLATGTSDGRVAGLRDFAPQDQPPLLPLLFYAFGRDRFRALRPDAVDRRSMAARLARSARDRWQPPVAAGVGRRDPARLYRRRHRLDGARGRTSAMDHLRTAANERRGLGAAGAKRRLHRSRISFDRRSSARTICGLCRADRTEWS